MNATTDDLLRGFTDLGLRAGDAVLVHSSYLALGDVDGGPEAVVDSLQAVVGERGTLVLPSFNWDYFRKPEKVIDIRETPSRMGAISEAFRRRKDVRRTRNLFHPLCVWGALTDAVLGCDMYDTWGDTSPYALMYDAGFTILLLGVDLNTCSILHYCEQRANAWYRVPVVYEGAIVDEAGVRVPTRCRRLTTRPGCVSDLNKAQSSLTPQNSRTRVIGNAVSRAIAVRPFVDEVCAHFESDRDYLLKTDALWSEMPVLKNAAAFTGMGLIDALFQKRRDLVSQGFDESLEHLRTIIPMKVRRFASGERAQTWVIPQRWEVDEAYIERDGERIVDVARHALHVYSYSQPFEGTVSRDELLRHITTDPARPDAIPYKYVFYAKDWGFCVRHADLARFDGDHYIVKIASRFTDGFLSIGEFTRPGLGERMVLFPIQLDHPAQCNDGLSGVAVAVALALRLLRLPSTRYTYRILFVPETIGPIAYLDRYRPLLDRVECGIAFDTVGHDNRMYMMRSLSGDSRIDRIAAHVLRYRDTDAQIFDFLDPAISSYCNDERILQSPGFDIPAVAFGRSPYPYYHSSLDTPDKVSQANLTDTLELVWEIVEVLETDVVPKRTFDSVPCLASYGLWNPEWSFDEQLMTQKILYHLDNARSVFDIAERVGGRYRFVLDLVRALEKHGLVMCEAPR